MGDTTNTYVTYTHGKAKPNNGKKSTYYQQIDSSPVTYD